MDFSNSLNEIFKQLEKFFKTETVVGNPIEVGNITLVPIISVSFGAGGGGGNKDSSNTGGGAGVGGRIIPHAVLVIKNDEVNVLPLSERGSMEKIFDMVPDIMSKFNSADTNSEDPLTY